MSSLGMVQPLTERARCVPGLGWISRIKAPCLSMDSVPYPGQARGLAHRVKGFLRFLPGSPGAVLDKALDITGTIVPGSAFAHRLQYPVEGGGQLLLDLDIADASLSVARLEALHLDTVGIECVVVGKDRIALDAAGDICPYTVRIGVHAHHLAPHVIGRVVEEDGVVQALAHLGSAVGADENLDVALDQLGDGEHRFVQGIEAASDFPGNFDMGGVVLADRDDVAAHTENVGGLKYRVSQKVERHLDAGVARHVLETGNALKTGDCDQTLQQRIDLMDLLDA